MMVFGVADQRGSLRCMILLDQTNADGSPAGIDLARAMLGGALGLLGTIVTLAISWLKDRNTDSIRAKRVEELSKRQTFWKDWCATTLPLALETQKSELEEQARTQLIALAEEMQKLPPSAPQASQPQRRRELWRRMFLIYKPARFVAWVPRLAFYAWLVCLPAGVWHATEQDFANIRQSYSSNGFCAGWIYARDHGSEYARNLAPHMIEGCDEMVHTNRIEALKHALLFGLEWLGIALPIWYLSRSLERRLPD